MPRYTDYTPDLIKQVDAYLKKCVDKRIVFHKTAGLRSDTYEERVEVKLPTIEGFAHFLGVSRKTIYNWRDDHTDFAEELEKITAEQFTRLVNGGLSNEYNSVIAKLMLSSNHGLKERVDATTDDKPISTFSDDQINRIASRIASGKGSDHRPSGT